MSRSTIKSVIARQIYNYRGHPAIEATIITESGASGTATCTAGLSIGSHEVVFSYDGDSKRFNGKGVTRAVEITNERVAPALIGLDAADQFLCDHTLLNLKEPEGNRQLGGNITAAVSAACLKAGAASLGIPLYRHIGGANAITLPVAAYGSTGGSGRHTDNPKAFSKPSYSFISYDFDTFSDAQFALWEVFNKWEEYLRLRYDFMPAVSSVDRTCTGHITIPAGIIDSEFQLYEMMINVIDKCGYRNRVGLQGDFAADCYYDYDTHLYTGLFDRRSLTREDMINVYKKLVDEYQFVILEDPLNENDYQGHAMIREAVDVQVVGDDLFTTNTERVATGIKGGAANTVLLKVNQIGTITQSLEMIQLAHENGYGIMPCSSRGEGLSIVDYCVGINAGSIRESCLGSGGSRFLEIERELGRNAVFAGKHGLKGRRFQ